MLLSSIVNTSRVPLDFRGTWNCIKHESSHSCLIGLLWPNYASFAAPFGLSFTFWWVCQHTSGKGIDRRVDLGIGSAGTDSNSALWIMKNSYGLSLAHFNIQLSFLSIWLTVYQSPKHLSFILCYITLIYIRYGIRPLMVTIKLSWKKQQLFEIEILCKILNVFTVTFDWFNAFLVNKNINFFPQKILLTSSFWMIVYI